MTTFNTTAYQNSSVQIGLPPVSVSTVSTDLNAAGLPLVPLGTVVRAVDPTYGEGTFVWLLGVANTAQGSVVTFNSSTGVTALLSTSSADGPVAVAVAPTVASTYGWYQISGTCANTQCTTTGATGRVFASATAGSVTSASTANYGIDGATIVTAVSAGIAVTQLATPFLNGNTGQ